MNALTTSSTSQYESLRVTPLHEDEGYLSPSEEDLKKSFPNRPTGFLNCKTRSSHRSESRQSRESGTVEESIEWDVIATIPYIRHEHFSWDRLKLPVPYRFYDEHRLCLRQIRKSPTVSYITDSSRKLPEVIENIWRSYNGTREEKEKNGERTKQLSQHTVAPLQAIQSGKEAPVQVSVKQFIQHIFHLLCGRESVSFSIIRGDKFTFKKNPLVLIYGMSPSVVHNLSAQYLNCGRIFKRLSHLSALHYDEKLMEREGLSSNAVFITFLKFISDYLKLYQISLMLKATNIHTFSSLVIFFEPFRYQLQALDKILELYINTDQITLLKGLNTMMLCCETPFLADLLRSLFIACSAAYLRYVSDWIFRGTLTRGFHIQTTKLSTYQDRRYWVKQFTQVTAVPCFLEDALSLIFETGKAVNLLNLIRNTEPRSTILSCILQDEGSIIKPAVDFKEVTALDKAWEIKLDTFFEEYSFLENDVETALIGAEAKRQTVIDFEAVEEAKLAFESKQEEIRRTRRDKKAERQRDLFNSLSQQLAQKRERKKHEKAMEKEDDDKRASYIAATDQRDLDEEMRLMKKHFGDKMVETVGVRNVRQRIAITENAVAVGVIENPFSGVIVRETIGGHTSELNAEEDNVDMMQHSFEQSTSTDLNTEEEIADIPVDPIEILESSRILNRVSASDDNDTSVSSMTAEDTEPNPPDEKFNPDKLKIRNPQPYNIDLDALGSSFIPQPLVEFNSNILGENHEDKNSLRHDSFFVNLFLNKSVVIPVGAQNRMVNSALLHYFIVEKKLFQHVEALNNYLCLQNGLFGHFLSTLFIQEVKNKTLVNKDDIPSKSGRLNEILGEAMGLSTGGSEKNDFRDNLGFILVRENNRNSVDFDSPEPVKSKKLTSRYEVLDNITLNYSVEWPLSILLTDDLLINYEKLFTFLMRLYRAELLLLSLSSVLKFKGSKSRQLVILHHYRYRMLHFVRTLRHYINVTVIHCAWTELASSFHKMNSLDRIYEGLVRHIKFVTTNCLLGLKGEGVKKLLVNQLIVIECFCTEVEEYGKGIDWDHGELHARRFARLDQKFKVWEEIQKVFIQGNSETHIMWLIQVVNECES
ncbi:unnamed protein product [Orchesella dallaii]|uniref:Gamma-tubulin complex component n=1 Tax=Orchesella dallaii TaxID=48710 RepID=A0ABP1QTB4_9HEXA